MKNLEICCFDPNSKYGTGIYSFMKLHRSPEVLVCQFGGETLEELKSSGKISPEAFLCPWEEASRLSDDLARQRYCSGPSRVTKERWWDMLEVLFPARWEHLKGSEVFMMPECITSNLYTFGVRIGEDYFSINEDQDISAERLVEMCKEFASAPCEIE